MPNIHINDDHFCVFSLFYGDHDDDDVCAFCDDDSDVHYACDDRL